MPLALNHLHVEPPRTSLLILDCGSVALAGNVLNIDVALVLTLSPTPDEEEQEAEQDHTEEGEAAHGGGYQYRLEVQGHGHVHLRPIGMGVVQLGQILRGPVSTQVVRKSLDLQCGRRGVIPGRIACDAKVDSTVEKLGGPELQGAVSQDSHPPVRLEGD